MAYLYILYSILLDKYYIGSTTDLPESRLRRHNSKHAGFTAKAKDWIIVYTEKFNDKATVLQREKEIKNWKSRKKIELLVRSVE